MAKPFGFKVKCPSCQNDEAAVRIDINDLSACTCVECDWTGSPAEAVAMLSEQVQRWQAVERWCKMAPDAMEAQS